MRGDELDRSLSEEEEILPSSGFTASVMEAVWREAAMPPPIAFPWKRALPGIIVSCATIFWLLFDSIVQLSHQNGGTGSPAWISNSLVSVLESPKIAVASWIALALVLSFVSVKLSMHLARGTSAYNR
jgi:hypothetical protein